MKKTLSLITELDKLKSVYRRSYITDLSRNENSAEHSWHLAVALMALRDFIPADVNINHAIEIALTHDICEIGAGDVSIHSPERAQKADDEKAYMDSFAAEHGGFAKEIKMFWEEYEAQESAESHWVKVVDRLLPFLLNIATDGLVWREEKISKSHVLEINAPIRKTAPQLYGWIKEEIDKATAKGWLLDE